MLSTSTTTTQASSPTTNITVTTKARIDELGVDVLRHVYSFLDTLTLSRISRVSKHWNLTASARLWRDHLFRIVMDHQSFLPMHLSIMPCIQQRFPATLQLISQGRFFFGSKWPVAEHPRSVCDAYYATKATNAELGQLVSAAAAKILKEAAISSAVDALKQALHKHNHPQLQSMLSILFALTRKITSPPEALKFYVLEFRDKNTSFWDFLFDFAKQLINFMSNTRIVLFTDHNDPRAKPLDHWKERKYWTWNMQTLSRFKHTRRKRNIGNGTIVFTTDAKIMHSAAWLRKRKVTIFYIHETDRRGPVPNAVTCLAATPVITLSAGGV